MTKTMAEVKRWDANGPMDLDPEGSYILATDYATLQQRCEQLEAALAAAAVKVPEEVVDASERIAKWGGEWDVNGHPYVIDDHMESNDAAILANFILQLAGRKDGRNAMQ